MKKNLLLLLCLLISTLSMSQERDVYIIYIGNSITHGAQLADATQEAPPVQASLWLQKQKGINGVKFSNQGSSGKTTVDFLPISQTYFPKVQLAADELKDDIRTKLIFSIMLGTNDSAIRGTNGSPVSPQQYYTNMKAIIDELLTLYPNCQIVLHRPIWYSPNTYNGAMYLKEGLLRLESYLPQLQNLVLYYATGKPNHVFMGDTEAFDYFKKNYLTDFNPEEGNAGTFYLHPNKKGAIKLGEYWGKAIYQVILNTK